MPTRAPGTEPPLRLLALFLLGLAGTEAAPAADLAIDTLAVEMRPLDAKVLFRKDPFDTSSFPVTVLDEQDGVVERLAGRIEVKGSFTRQTRKKSVLIKLAGGKWRGQGRISLNGMGTDGSLVREWLAWDLMHALGMVTPGTHYTRLSVNGRDRGLFLRIDWIDPKLFERAGLGADGEMYHPNDITYCADLTPASLAPRRECWLKLSPREPDRSSLKALTEALVAEPVDTFHQLVDRRFDAESVVNWFAVNALVSETDTYNKNYFLYLSRVTGKWLVVPWDYDLTFGRSFDPYREFPGTILNDHFQYYFPIEAGQSNPLHYQALKNTELRRRIVARLRALIDGTPDAAHPWSGWFAPERMLARIDQLRSTVLPELRRDPFLAGTEADFEDEIASLRFYAVARAQYLRHVVLGKSGWAVDTASAPLADDTPAELVDGWGYLLGRVSARGAAGRARLDVRRGWPELVPENADRNACVQRTWLLSGPPGAVTDLTLAYLDENSHAREPGPAVADERSLQLFAHEGAAWRWLPTTAAPLANTLSVSGLRLPAQGPLRLVACVAAPAPVATAGSP